MFIFLIKFINIVSITKKIKKIKTKLFNNIITYNDKNAITSYKNFIKKF